MKTAAISILSRAVELDKNKRYTEALLMYQEGIQILLDLQKSQSGDNAAYYITKIEEYMTRAEKIKKIVDELKTQGKYHEQINIQADSTGHSYNAIFGRFLNDDVKAVDIEDPYIRMYHQLQNFLRFIETAMKHCKNLTRIHLVTCAVGGDQQVFLDSIKCDLKDNYSIDLDVEFSHSLHDRKITLSNGWIIKIGRGLDYFKAPKSKNSIGKYDLDLRPCYETTVDIFHSNSVIEKNVILH